MQAVMDFGELNFSFVECQSRLVAGVTRLRRRGAKYLKRLGLVACQRR